MAITNRDELVAALATVNVMGLARLGELDALFESGAAPTTEEVSAALKAKTQIAALTPVTVANATDEATAVALTNANKVAINALIAALKA